MNTISVKQVYSRIFRNNRGIDTSYSDDILEWIAEGMSKLKTYSDLSKTSVHLNVKQHCVQLPCDYVSTIGVIYNSVRLQLSSNGRHFNNITPLNKALDDNIFIFDYSVPNTDPLGDVVNKEDHWKGNNIKQLSSNSTLKYTYIEELGYIKTSFEEGTIELHYLKRPCDEEGFPLIPDIENYKTALYWYVTMMLVGSGYTHPNKEFTHSYCLQLFDMYSNKALGELKYPSVEGMERLKNQSIRLIPLQDDWDNFMSSGNSKENIYT